MKPIGVGFIFRATKNIGNISLGLHRVIEESGVSECHDRLLVIIQIPEPPPPKEKGKKQPSYYAKGFKIVRLETVRQLLDQGKIIEADVPRIPPWWGKSDAELLASCSRNRWVEQDEGWVTPEIRKRDTKWQWIEPLVSLFEARKISSVAELDALVPARAQELCKGENQVYDALHRFFAFGENKDALLPYTPDSGGKGKKRFGKNGVLSARV